MKIQATPRYTQQVSSDKQISPPVNCFCCQDSGLISNIYLSEFVEIPDRGDILPYICQRENCANGQAYLRAYNMSDQERDTWHNNQTRGKDGDNIPRPMRSRDYQANFSTNLNDRCCDWLHDRSYDDWLESIRNPRKVAIAEQFTQAVSDRKTIYKEIETEVAKFQSDFINPKIEKFLNFCRDRDSIQYLNIEALPTSDYSKLLSKIRGLAK
jgi:hypothetical protein